YRPKPDGWTPLVRLGVVLGVLVLLGASAYGAWAVYFKDAAERTSKQQVTALGLVPEKAVSFFCVRPNTLLKSKHGQGLIQSLNQLPLNEKELNRFIPREALELVRLLDTEVGLRTPRVESVVGVNFGTDGLGLVVETTADMHPGQKENLKNTLRTLETNTFAGKTFFHSRGEPKTGLYFVHDRLFVVTQKDSAMRLFLETLDKKRDEQGRIERAIAQADQQTVLLA